MLNKLEKKSISRRTCNKRFSKNDKNSTQNYSE